MTDTIRSISIRYYKLPFRAKVAISHNLGLFNPEDSNLSDLERFKKVLKLAKERCLFFELLKEIEAYEHCS